MLFTEPTPFAEALESRAVKVAVPTTLSSRELQGAAGELLERSLFAARVTNAEFLDEFDGLVREILNPRRVTRADGTVATEGMDYATARLKLKQYLDRTGYHPEAGKEGTIEDLRSDRRLNLILETNTQMAQGYGGEMQGNDPAVLEQWPAAELYRAEERKEKRPWPVTWLSAAAEVGDEKAGEALRKHGMMAARKDSRIWRNLGPFKLPYAPFDWGSGMDKRDVEREAALAMGLISEEDRVQPERARFNELLQARPEVRSEGLRKALLDSLGEDYEFAGTGPDGPMVLRKKPGGPGAETGPAAPPAPAPLPKIELPSPGVKKKAERPVSDALQVLRRKPTPLEDLKRAIDEVHDDGVLPRLPVDGRTQPGNLGEFRYVRVLGRPDSIGVRARAGEELTFAHEIGHFLDFMGLGNPGNYASERHAEMQAWRDAVARTELVQRLREAMSRAENAALRRHYTYLASWPEAWARSYAQWLTMKLQAGRIGEAALRARILGELRVKQRNPEGWGHWSDEDFKGIAAAMDEIFRKKGWLIE